MLKQLKYFQSVARLNSFSEAAEENFISFTLTPAGAYFYQKSLILTADYGRMCSEAAKIAKGDQASLRIGYLRCYTGGEFHRALELFSEKQPDVDVSVISGNHEELYAMLRTGQADLILNDQRRAFSDEYVNLLLTTCESYVEVSARSPLAQLSQITPAQRETEQEYYQTIVGLQGEFLYAENMEEARLMVLSRKGFLPVEGTSALPTMGNAIVRLPLVRGEGPILRNYCAFWKKDNSGCYVEEFAKLLKGQFEDESDPEKPRNEKRDR